MGTAFIIRDCIKSGDMHVTLLPELQTLNVTRFEHTADAYRPTALVALNLKERDRLRER